MRADNLFGGRVACDTTVTFLSGTSWTWTWCTEVAQTHIQAAGLSALVGTAIAWLINRGRDRKVRREDLAWRKSEFLLTLSQRFDEEPSTGRALLLLEGRDQTGLVRMLDAILQDLSDDEAQNRLALYRYLDFFDRLHAYIFITEAIAASEAMMFSGYLDFLGAPDDPPPLRTWAEDNGYVNAVVLYDEFRRLNREYYATVERIQAQVDVITRTRGQAP